MGLGALGMIVLGVLVFGIITDDTVEPTTDNEGNPCPKRHRDDDEQFPQECHREF